MSIRIPKFVLTLVLISSLVSAAVSDTLAETTWTLDEASTKRTTPEVAKPIIDVPEPLRKLFPILGEIESKVAVGRRTGDPNTLLQAVRDLGQAEFFSGLQGAGANSDILLEQATELAWQQRDPVALRESLVLWSQPNRAGRSPGKILETSERLEEVEKERGEMLTKKRCRIIFHNRTHNPVEVFVNRRPIGTLAPGQTQEVAELLAGRQYLGANDADLQWGPRQVYVGPGEIFNWRLFD